MIYGLGPRASAGLHGPARSDRSRRLAAGDEAAVASGSGRRVRRRSADDAPGVGPARRAGIGVAPGRAGHVRPRGEQPGGPHRGRRTDARAFLADYIGRAGYRTLRRPAGCALVLADDQAIVLVLCDLDGADGARRAGDHADPALAPAAAPARGDRGGPGRAAAAVWYGRLAAPCPAETDHSRAARRSARGCSRRSDAVARTRRLVAGHLSSAGHWTASSALGDGAAPVERAGGTAAAVGDDERPNASSNAASAPGSAARPPSAQPA